MVNIKLFVVGDGAVGKTALCLTYVNKVFPQKYIPTAIDCILVNETVDGEDVSVALWDTAGGEDFDRLRPLGYPDTDVFLICFAVDSTDSLENVETRWLPELHHFCPGVPVVLVASKIDLRANKKGNILTYDDGLAVAKKYGWKYCETSALKRVGLNVCFEEGVRTALASLGEKKRFRLFGGKQRKQIPHAPVMPPKGLEPSIEIQTSTFGEDWYKMIQNPVHSDVTFVLEGQHNIQAHSVVLCSASKVFAKLFGISKDIQDNQVNTTDCYSWDQVNAGAIPMFVAIYNKEVKEDGQSETVIEITPEIPAKTFKHVLEFLYSGVLRNTDYYEYNMSEDEICELDRVAAIFEMPLLQTICSNILTDQEFLNSSIGTFLNDETGVRMKELFFNKKEKSDVVFCVEGKFVYAHKAVLAARCDVMAAMLSGNFHENKTSGKMQVNIPDTTLEAFLPLLEYLYTDNAPIEDTDPVGILMQADKYNQKQLCNLCELYITKEVDGSVTNCIEKADIDVIGLLHTAQRCNADQLAEWCLYFVANNYTAFQEQKEFGLLKGDNKVYVEKNRWPPASYLVELEKYNKKYVNDEMVEDKKKKDKHCTMM